MTAAAVRWRFLVEAHAEPDALVRVLTPFSVQGAQLVEVTLDRVDGGLAIRIESEGLEAVRAETLLRRLEGLPVVRRVGLGWQAAQAA